MSSQSRILIVFADRTYGGFRSSTSSAADSQANPIERSRRQLSKSWDLLRRTKRQAEIGVEIRADRSR